MKDGDEAGLFEFIQATNWNELPLHDYPLRPVSESV